MRCFYLLLAVCFSLASCSSIPFLGSNEGRTTVDAKQYTIAPDKVGSFLQWFYNQNAKRDTSYYYQLGALLWEFPNDERLISLLDNEQSPMVLASIMVEHKMASWQRSPLPDSGGDLELAPPKRVILDKPVFYRGEFESNLEFSIRMNEAIAEYEEAQEIEDLLYKRRLVEYEEIISYQNGLVDLEKARRDEVHDELRLRFLQQSLSIVVGGVYLTQPRYDVDSGTLFALMSTTRSALNKTISFVVPLEVAKEMVFRLDEASLRLNIYWDASGDLVLSNQVGVEFDDISYLALILDYSDIPSIKPVRVN